MQSTITWLGIELFVLIAACFSLSYGIMRGLHRLNQRSYRLFRFILLPGVIIHELSHAFACVITGTPIVELKFWTETGGHVVHHRPKWPIITQPIISLAPFLIGTLTLIYLPSLVIATPWYLSILLAWLLASIAATLAPSLVDITHAAEGLLVMALVAGTIFYSFPGLLTELEPSLITIRTQLWPIVIILVGIWVGLQLLYRATRHH